MQPKKELVFLASAFIIFISLSCQEPYEKGETFYPYWHQKASLFRILPDSENEIIFLGDSLTDGGHWSEMFPDRNVINRGISGDQTSGVISRLDEVIESEPLKIFLMIGINDLAEGKIAEEVVYNIKQIVRIIHKRSPDTEIFLQSLLPVNKDFDFFPNHVNKTGHIIRVNRALKNFSDANDISYINLYPLFATKDNQLNPKHTNDGLHLKGSGYLIWKKAVEEHIN